MTRAQLATVPEQLSALIPEIRPSEALLGPGLDGAERFWEARRGKNPVGRRGIFVERAHFVREIPCYFPADTRDSFQYL